jgi:hypothetical protein
MMHHLIYNELILQTKHPLNDILLSPTNAFFISTLNSFHLFFITIDTDKHDSEIRVKKRHKQVGSEQY